MIGKDGVFYIVNNKEHVCSIRFTTEEYGWLARYAEKNDTTISAVVRRAVKTYRKAVKVKAEQRKSEE